MERRQGPTRTTAEVHAGIGSPREAVALLVSNQRERWPDQQRSRYLLLRMTFQTSGGWQAATPACTPSSRLLSPCGVHRDLQGLDARGVSPSLIAPAIRSLVVSGWHPRRWSQATETLSVAFNDVR